MASTTAPGRSPLLTDPNLGEAPSLPYLRGIELFRQDTAARAVFFIASGSVKLSRLQPDGRQLIAAVRSAGDVLGAAPVMCRRPHPLTAITMTHCQLVRIEGEKFLDHVRNDPKMMAEAFRSLGSETVDYAIRLSKLACLSARQDLVAMLNGMLLDAGLAPTERNVRLQFSMRRYEIAESMGITPQHLSRLLKQLERDGLIRQEKGWIKISDPDKLRRLS